MKIYIPDDLLGKTEDPKRHKPREWKHIYFFRGSKKKNQPFNTTIIEDWIPKAVKSYNKNTLYKVKTLSDYNNLWDYYRILKPNIKTREAKEMSGRSFEKIQKKNQLKGVHFCYYPKDNPFILKF